MSVFPDPTPIPPTCPHGHTWLAWCKACWDATPQVRREEEQ